MYLVMANLNEKHSPLFLLQARLFHVHTEGGKNKCPPLVCLLSVSSDCLKMKVNRLSNITINKAGLLFICRLNRTAFKVAYVCFWKYVFVTVAICYFVVTELCGNLKHFCFNAGEKIEKVYRL